MSQGAVTEAKPLGIEADEPGSMWLDGEADQPANRVIIRQNSPRSFDSAEVSLDAPLDARLTVELTAADAPDRVIGLSATLSQLLANVQSKDLDGQGNRVLMYRAPGDSLRVEIPRDNLVFSPGETFKFKLKANLLPLPTGSKARVRVQLFPARSQRELWSTVHSIQVGETASLPIEVPMREEEGVFDVAISVANGGGWPQAMRQPLMWNKPVADRTVQVVVLGPHGPGTAAKGEADLAQVVAIDPANPRWSELLAKLPQSAKLSRLLKAPLGNGTMRPWRHPLGELARLNPNRETSDVSWEAYTLPISQPGRSHILEVEYPSDVPQTLGLSVLEPDASGVLVSSGVDSGVDLVEELVSRTPRMLRHRVVFWPHSSMPVLLVANRRTDAPAVYGKIRVLAGWDRLPRLSAAAKPQSARLIAAYFDRPSFADNFSASEMIDHFNGHGLDDWLTFHEGGARLVEYLQYRGYNGLMLSVMADGSAIYPAESIAPTPRFDKGALFATGQDPLRKDVLEMLARMFDREQLTLIPAIDFCAPLPALEAAIRRGGPQADALRWIGADGAPLQQSAPPRRGQSPYYNTLHPQVQEAMLAVVGELAARYADHPSFGGLALQLSARGYAQLPGPEWGLDDATIARFEREARVKVPGTGANRFAQRGEFLAGPGHDAWHQWRADTLHAFYGKVEAAVRAVRPEARVYLAGANMFSTPEWQNMLRPALPQRATLADAMLRVGIDPRHYQTQRGIVLLRPERNPASADAADRAMQLEMLAMADFDRLFQHQAVTGSIFHQQPMETRVESFDQQSPFKPCYTLLTTQTAPSDQQNRRRFVHSLATLDSQVLIDGGSMLSLGQEESLRSLVAAYRRLPAVPMTRAAGDADAATQPVVVRTATYAGRTYLYAVNDSPLRVNARLRINAPAACRMEDLSGMRQVPAPVREGDTALWTVDLEPFDMIAMQLSQPGAAVSQLQVVLPVAAEKSLGNRIRDLGSRAAALGSPPPIQWPANANFEGTPAGDEPLPDWLATRGEGVSITTDKAQRQAGTQSARLSSTGPVASLMSRPFPAPNTGRLSMSVWLRAADPNRQPLLRLAFEGRSRDQPYYRYAEVGAPAGSAPGAVPVGRQWAQFVFPVDDIPLAGMSHVRVRFDLMGAGDVWIDDVQLYDLAFNEKERRELAKLITVAEYQLQSKQVSDCVALLDGYWPRYLQRHVPAQGQEVAAKTAAEDKPDEDARSADASKSPRTGLMDRVKDLVPEKLRF